MKNYDEQIAKAEEQIKQLNNKKKRPISEQKQAERKKRTKRLIERVGTFTKCHTRRTNRGNPSFCVNLKIGSKMII